MRCLKTYFTVLIAMLLSVAAQADTIDVFSAKQQNLQILQQAAAMTTVELGDEYGLSTGSLTYSGMFNNTIWSLHLTGTFAGQSVDLSFMGTTTGPDANNHSSGSYTDTGFVGGDGWMGGGIWGSSPSGANPPDSNVLAVTWTSSDTVTFANPHHQPPHREHDTEVVSEFHYPDGTDLIQYYHTINGERVGTLKHEISEDGLGGRSGGGSFRTSMNFTDDGILLSGLSNYNNDPTFSTTSGTISVVPLPSTALLAGTLLAACGILYAGFGIRASVRA